MGPLDFLTIPENLYWAWNKTKTIYTSGDAWYDEMELAAFEANLDVELQQIGEKFREGVYRLSPIRPLPHPKKVSSQKESPIREMFWVRVRDQVAWIAVINVIGPELDQLMPPWSYGNRLHRPVWYESIDTQQFFRRGPYRKTSRRLYRVFRQSWPLFRRHLALTVRTAAGFAEPPEDEGEQRVLQAEEQLSERDSARLPYLVKGWWRKPAKTLYRAHIDFRKFYPTIKLSTILDIIKECSPDRNNALARLIEAMLAFPLDLRGWSPNDLTAMGLHQGQEIYQGLPPGLMVAGFLSNVAMLRLDRSVQEKTKQHQVAHFRYVDDHTFLAATLEKLLEWLEMYHEMVQLSGVGASFHREKIDPPSVKRYVRKHLLGKASRTRQRPLTEELRSQVEAEAALDPKYPSPLMTATLARISDVSHTLFTLLDERGQDQVLKELEFLLTARLPDDEIRDDTRVSFAAGRLATLAPKRFELLPREARGKFAQRLFHLMLRSIRAHPEKLSLWSRILEFCRKTGFDQLGQLKEEIDRVTTSHPLPGKYLNAYIKQVLARQVFRCLYTIRDTDLLPQYRLDACSYLTAILDLGLVTQVQKPLWFEKHADRVLQAVSMVVGLLVLEIRSWPHTPTALREALEPTSHSGSARQWPAHFVEWVGNERDGVSLWTWWLDRNTAYPLALDPGRVWTCLAELLSVESKFTWAVWSRYPDHFPLNRLKDIETNTGHARPIQAWYYEVWKGIESRTEPFSQRRLRELTQSAGMPSVGIPTGYSSLDEWANWTAAIYHESPHDPRTGEWTAVCLVDLIAKLVSERQDIDGTHLHPANILIPSSWMESGETPFTWESWSRVLLLDDRTSPRLKEQQLLRDFRFVITSPEGEVEDQEWSLVQGLGMVLLGLLARTFRRPALWNQPGYALANPYPVITLIHSLAISSWTTAVLEATLLPRSRENLLLSRLVAQLRLRTQDDLTYDDDTTNDPPEIGTVVEFRRFLAKAQAVLKDYQLMVHDSMPRQLILRRLGQLKSTEWETGYSEGNPDDDA